ncbi:hypothetical protein [Bacteroides reticulotermitis]|uniref:HU family DNA-binding protein n=1 Tax=Bacteroides reticulotermitis TaxID=1133319 RepID=UPI0034E28CB2
MSIYYDLYNSGNPLKREKKQPLPARVIPSGTIDARNLSDWYPKRVISGKPP